MTNNIHEIRESLSLLASQLSDSNMVDDFDAAFATICEKFNLSESVPSEKLHAWIPVPSLFCSTPANPHTSADCPPRPNPHPAPSPAPAPKK